MRLVEQPASIYVYKLLPNMDIIKYVKMFIILRKITFVNKKIKVIFNLKLKNDKNHNPLTIANIHLFLLHIIYSLKHIIIISENSFSRKAKNINLYLSLLNTIMLCRCFASNQFYSQYVFIFKSKVFF